MEECKTSNYVRYSTMRKKNLQTNEKRSEDVVESEELKFVDNSKYWYYWYGIANPFYCPFNVDGHIKI